jgi:peptidoglycan hydrolase CwlO-like protein
MKKIIITLAIALIGTFGYSQTYKKVVSGKDTLLTVVQTKTTTDTLKRKDLKEQIAKYKADKESRQESIKALKANIDFYGSEIARLTALLRKTY